MNKGLKIIVLLFIISAIVGCKSQKSTVKRTVKNKSTSFLVEKLKANEFNNDWISLKAGIAFKMNKISDSFKMHIRMKKDSAIWISATYYSVEVARFLITSDTVKFMDRKANQYFVGGYDYIHNRFNIATDFESLQSILLGNSVGIKEIDKVKSYNRDGLYHLSSFGRRKMKKAAEHGEKVKIELAYKVSIDPENYKVVKLSIHDFKLNKSLVIDYEDHQKIENQLFPKKYQMTVHAEKEIESTIEYLKTTLNKPQKLSFNIPEKYERIN